jgi:4a-hydroxytetrahydrobiopterin dehydratase
MPAAAKLTDAEITAGLAGLVDWRLAAGKLHRELRFRDFVEAFAFMTRVALLAEKRDHHPEWSNVYATVVIDLQTHDAGGITALDLELAAAIDQLLDDR